MHEDRLLEVLECHGCSSLVPTRRLFLIVLTDARVQLGEERVGFDCGCVSASVDSSQVVGDVFGEADSLDVVAGEVSGADEVTAEVEEDFGWPGTLGFAGVPQVVEEVLYLVSEIISIQSGSLTSRVS